MFTPSSSTAHWCLPPPSVWGELSRLVRRTVPGWPSLTRISGLSKPAMSAATSITFPAMAGGLARLKAPQRSEQAPVSTPRVMAAKIAARIRWRLRRAFLRIARRFSAIESVSSVRSPGWSTRGEKRSWIRLARSGTVDKREMTQAGQARLPVHVGCGTLPGREIRLGPGHRERHGQAPDSAEYHLLPRRSGPDHHRRGSPQRDDLQSNRLLFRRAASAVGFDSPGALFPRSDPAHG